jgi:hypothetical protein
MSDVDKARDLLERALRELGHLDNGAPEHCLAMATIGTGFATLAVHALGQQSLNEEALAGRPDLSMLTVDELADLSTAIVNEQRRRLVSTDRVPPERGEWNPERHPRGGADQWNG